MKKALWHLHPHVNNNLTAGDRVADWLRNFLASWTFFIGSIAYMGAWILIAKLRLAPIDNPQLTYLNLILSCAAALSSSIILLSQKRSDVIASEVALHTQANTDELKSQSGRILELQEAQMEMLSGLEHISAELSLIRASVVPAAPRPVQGTGPAGGAGPREGKPS